MRSEIARREIAGDLDKQQIANLRAVEPHLAAEMLAKIDQHKEAAGASRAARVSTETLLPEKVAQERAQTEQYRANTRSTLELLDYQKRNYDANITQSLAAAGASNTNAYIARKLYPLQMKELENKNNEYVQLEMQGQKFTAKGIEVAKERDRRLKEIADLEKERQTRLRETRKDDAKALADSVAAETKLKTLAEGSYTLKPEEVYPQADVYHSLSKNPYVYVLEPDPSKWEKFTGQGDDTAYRKIRKVDLPVVDGHKYTAQEVYDAATAKNMTVQQYLEQVFYPSLRQQVPWTVPPAAK